MKKSVLILCLSILALTELSAQKAAKSVFFELGGPGVASINFDTRFSKKESGLGGRIGVGGFSFNFDSDENSTIIFVPVGLNYIVGKDNKNYFEMGAGITPVFYSGEGDGDFSSTFGHLNFGYRLQPLNGGFTFRAFITPIFGSFGFVPYYGGVSFGYKF